MMTLQLYKKENHTKVFTDEIFKKFCPANVGELWTMRIDTVNKTQLYDCPTQDLKKIIIFKSKPKRYLHTVWIAY